MRCAALEPFIDGEDPADFIAHIRTPALLIKITTFSLIYGISYYLFLSVYVNTGQSDSKGKSNNRVFLYSCLLEAIHPEFPESCQFWPLIKNSFYADKAKVTQWEAFLRKNKLEKMPFDEVVLFIRDFLTPIIEAQLGNHSFSQNWTPAGPWALAGLNFQFLTKPDNADKQNKLCLIP